MRAFLLALATIGSLAAAAPSLAQTLKVNQDISIDVTGFSGDPKILSDMVTKIESLNGGRVAAVTFDNVGGAPGYSAIVLNGADVRFWRLDSPTSDAVEIIGASVPSWMLNWKAQRRATAVKDAKVSLADAIRTAQAARKGAPAVVAGIARSASNPTSEVHAYMVGILKDGRLERVAVDSQSGRPIENPEALEW
ncbi:MAG: hypothetical protein C0481_01255 [Phenylobacterium sp.]|uniref:hypothetical protein n=1 Tax=Phenylobacterium sp. TaxID=1871053 RepID=UPI0025D609B6|nr:hypothetical protein [Phenylobacterium sp.]MBA4010468.1 hypothetical protein [Phenylobacterium sp.]